MARRKNKVKRKQPKPGFSLQESDNYLMTSCQLIPIGEASGSSVASICWNDYMLNGGAAISLGTANNQRLGKHILFTYARITGLLTLLPGASTTLRGLRIIVAKNPKDSTLANANSSSNAASFFESTEILEAPQFNCAINSGTVSTAKPLYPISKSTDYTILYDRVHLANQPALNNTNPNYGVITEFVDIVVPLALKRSYTTVGTPTVDMGSFGIYMGNCDKGGDSATHITFSGTVQASFVNCWSWEELTDKANAFLNGVNRVYLNARNLPVVNAAMEYIPSLLAGM